MALDTATPRARRALLVVVALVLVGATVRCSSAASTSTPAPELQRQADLRAIEQIEVTFHRAASTKDIDLMMSIWADNATLVLGPQTYTGKDEIRDFWLTKSGPFKPENHWEGDTPAYKIVSTVDGDKGTIYYECHFVDVVTRAVASATASNQSVARINGVWLITNSVGGTATLGP
jgi:ketosteroid isomerase-like protein